MATSFVNVVAIALKDKAFARMMSKEPAAFPLASYGASVVPPIGYRPGRAWRMASKQQALLMHGFFLFQPTLEHPTIHSK